MIRQSSAKKDNRSSSGKIEKSSSLTSAIFLEELIPQILIFAVAGCICMQLFVHAHLMTQQAKIEDKSMTQISGVIETAAAASSPDALADCFEAVYPYCRVDGENISIYYDADFSEVPAAEAVYTLDVVFSLSDGMLTTSCVMTDEDGKETCSLSADHYFQGVTQ